MLALKIIAVILGLAFTLFGYFIFFKKKYSLINGFEEDYKAGRKTEDYENELDWLNLSLGLLFYSQQLFLWYLLNKFQYVEQFTKLEFDKGV